MNCAALQQWLDDGMPEARAADARAHLATCAACAREFDVARALSAAFAQAPAVSAPVMAPAGFADEVMAQIAASRAARVLPATPAPVLPWWVQIASQPAVGLACVLAALLVWKGGAMLEAGVALLTLASTSLASASAQGLSLGIGPLPAPFADPLVMLGLGVAALPLVAYLSFRLYGWSERLFVPRPEIASAGAHPARG